MIIEPDTQVLAAQNQFHGNPSYAMMTDISKPLIAIEFGDQMKLIDGNHRLYKAVNTGKQTVKAIFLSHPNIYDILEFMTKRFTKR